MRKLQSLMRNNVNTSMATGWDWQRRWKTRALIFSLLWRGQAASSMTPRGFKAWRLLALALLV